MEEERPARLRNFEVAVVSAGVLAAVFFGCTTNRTATESLALSRQLAEMEKSRSEAEAERAAVRDFVGLYFSSSCVNQVGLMQLPLRRSYNLDESSPPEQRGETAMQQRCAKQGSGVRGTYVVTDVRVTSPIAPGEYTITAELIYDSGGDDGMHRLDGTTTVEMTVAKTGEKVKSAADFKLVSLAEVICTVKDNCR